ncbi:EPIDERMAL PATTERNING FACTOR-like protein 5 [Salvia hispanica]|uniref:EPIDERMAL PATTERNING FACTOR-like protein 5 n=1 Tax=Salvia hispanica TaxID=49212 RepID=UPI002009ACB9|nr:EPIDERMAL PATTERNING FACTOR-like protein 5 [Salvia hispanica]XP_047952695.1 EPIDERMAL PATTERNING FACTOR-like protein 5 [Salvia hispanica]
MAISTTYTFAALLLSIFFLSLPLQSGGIGMGASMDDEVKKEIKMGLGSKPPACLNRCMSCRPCVATLAIPSQSQKRSPFIYVKFSHAQDDTYYLLSWRCTCGNKLFQP